MLINLKRNALGGMRDEDQGCRTGQIEPNSSVYNLQLTCILHDLHVTYMIFLHVFILVIFVMMKIMNL